MKGAAWSSLKAVRGNPQVMRKIWDRTCCRLVLEESNYEKIDLIHHIYHASSGADGAVQELHCRPKWTLDAGRIAGIERDRAGSLTVMHA